MRIQPCQADILVRFAQGKTSIGWTASYDLIDRRKPRSAIFPDEWAVIRMLVVAPERRGRGIGRQLVAACLRHAIRDGAPAIGLHTSPMIATALRLYTTLGFTRERDLDPIDGVAYGRYVLPAGRIQAALDQLASWPA